jgi:hypothetical protein
VEAMGRPYVRSSKLDVRWEDMDKMSTQSEGVETWGVKTYFGGFWEVLEVEGNGKIGREFNGHWSWFRGSL